MTCQNHEYIAGRCVLCNEPQPQIINGKERKLSNDLSGLKIPLRAKSERIKHITSEFQMVVDETMTYLGENIQKRGNFAKYCGIIKKIGIERTRIWIKEMRQRKISSPAYFLAIYKQHNKTTMKKIKLTQGKYALIDDEDYLYLSRFKWTLNKKKREVKGNIYEYDYAGKTIQRNKVSVVVYMFEFLIEAVNYECVVFKNKNTLDYRKSNLGLVSYGTRGTMAKKRKGTYSKYKGLTYRPRKKVFEVRVCKDKKTYYLGKFKNEKKAAIAYNIKAKELYGEFAYQNKL